MSKKKPFNNPFSAVKLPQPPRPAPPPPKAPEPPPSRRRDDLTEEELWTVAVDGAKPLADRESKLTDLNAKLTALYTSLQEVDMPPTTAMVDAAAELRRRVTEALVAPTKTRAR